MATPPYRRSTPKGVIALVLAFTTAALLASAATPAPFTGTWLRDAKASSPVGGRIGGPGRDIDAVTLVIEDRDGIFQISREVSVAGGQAPPLVQRFRWDGTETTNPAPAPGGRRGEVHSRIRREGSHVIIEGRQTITADIEVKTTDVYDLSSDGNTLTITTTRSNGMATDTTKQVYRRK